MPILRSVVLCVLMALCVGRCETILSAETLDLDALMKQYQPPYAYPGPKPDPAITFERFDVVESAVFDSRAPYYLSIGRDGGYLFKIASIQRTGEERRPEAILQARLSPERLKELQWQLKATDWLTAAGGAGIARHTDASEMRVAVTREGRTTKLTMQGDRPEPYAALQKFIGDLAWQEEHYYRLTRVPAERVEATRELHDAIGAALRLPARGLPVRTIDFARYFDLFSHTLDDWYVARPDDLTTAIDLMLLLKRVDRADAVARLRFDRDSNVRKCVARALPVLLSEKAIPLLVDMIPSTAEARFELVRLGEPAVPTIAEIIESDEAPGNSAGVLLMRAYIDHWKELPGPLDPRIVAAVLANMQHEMVRGDLAYRRELLKLAGVAEPKTLTALETTQAFLKHFAAADAPQLDRLKGNSQTSAGWLALRAKLDPKAEFSLAELWTDDFGGMALSKTIKNKAGDEVHLVVFMRLSRGTDWRVYAVLAEPADLHRQKDQFLKNSPRAKQTWPE